jgi:NADH-quinone oxidoreductase subunit L
MTIPLVVLAILSIIGGYVGLPAVFSEHHTLGNFLSSSVTNAGTHHLDHGTEWMLLGISTVVAVVFSIAGYAAYRKPDFSPNTGLSKVLENKWYVDELYDAIIVRPLSVLSGLMDRFVERMGIDGAVNGTGKLVRWGSDRVRLLQSGQVGFYIFVMVIGITALFALSFFWIK